jgi:hypothetical protein
MTRRELFAKIDRRVRERRKFMQVLAGPRQVGKTTLIRQVLEGLNFPNHYASADEPTLKDSSWLEQQWEIGRLRAKEGEALLVLDEIQKVQQWPDLVKTLWDQDTAARRPLKVVLLGSSPLLIQKGLTESLAGRFELIPVPHWSWPEIREAFGWNLDQYVFYGAYPGAAELIDEPERWRHYILDSLIETTISRDIFLMSRVDKPALLRRLLHLGCAYSAQVLSYQKMLGQLTDAGNTTTLAHYLELLSAAGMLTGLQKYSNGQLRQRGSSPKLQVLNTALMSAVDGRSFQEARADTDYWWRLVESCVGAHLINSSFGTDTNVFYWRAGNEEVDFVLQRRKKIVAVEVKSGARRQSLRGMSGLLKIRRSARPLLVGGQGLTLDEFLSKPADAWFD